MNVFTVVNKPEILPYYAEGKADNKPKKVAGQEQLMSIIFKSAVFPHEGEQFDHHVDDVEPEKRSINDVTNQELFDSKPQYRTTLFQVIMPALYQCH